MPSTILFFVGICTYPISYDIKCAVVTQAEDLKKFHEVPYLGGEGHISALKYTYKYIRCYENIQGIKNEETSYENLN